MRLYNRKVLTRVTAAVLWAVAGDGRTAAQGQSLSAEEVAQQFVARQYELTPVAGEFVVTGTSRQDPKRMAELTATGWTPAPSEPLQAQSRSMEWGHDRGTFCARCPREIRALRDCAARDQSQHHGVRFFGTARDHRVRASRDRCCRCGRRLRSEISPST